MKIWFLTFLLLSLGFISLSQASVFRSGEDITVSGQIGDNLYAAASEISADFNSTDDVFMAGGNIAYTAGTTADTFLAGGTVNVKDSKSQMFAVAGGKIRISDATVRELVAAGTDLRIDRILIQDDMALLGGEMTVGKNARVTGSTLIAGGVVTLAGNFTGEVRVFARELHIESTAVIDGELIYRAEKAEIEPAAQIRGKTTVLDPVEKKNRSPIFVVVLGTLFVFGALLVAPLVVLAFPMLAAQGRQQIKQNLVGTAGLGAIVALATPIAISILLASVVGTFVGLTLIPFVLVGGVLAWSLAAYTLGLQFRLLIKKTETPANRLSQFAWTLLASLALVLLLALPLLGFAAHLFGMTLGLGALVDYWRKWFKS